MTPAIGGNVNRPDSDVPMGLLWQQEIHTIDEP